MAAVDRRAFRSDDARAADRGWQVSRPRRFTRRYRDPRWDLVAQCPICAGEGLIGARTCPMCDGNGRVWTDPHGDEHERAS
ncbi:hypothetical protein BJF78_19710 [Pseudonocardia sp. CNS-139]|nr:hypothetical protein BJF78_19710 [Pseudonocardia sp. CNS-139]